MGARLETLRTEILRERRCGETTVALQDYTPQSPNVAVNLNSFVSSLGFTSIGDHWLEIGDDDARALLLLILTRDLAYNCEIMPRETAEDLVSRFLAIFALDHRCFTNGTLYKCQSCPTWTPISEATVDTGVICADADRIGILWIQDED